MYNEYKMRKFITGQNAKMYNEEERIKAFQDQAGSRPAAAMHQLKFAG